ncbi:hypothetical protein HRI_004481700 [Hibiscus trionum]|uniref:Retrovirus-related Pol polyprotein from transposon TNT 1-94-like beta-barrel domain-containing protein n=1 Tax=Hibiscus trionum TaxID=183268 RepID=A0A9W7MQS8_HIBTR|nr:hypothetical protein HRI_004481700 [Hibiscus trionum]
MANDTLETTIPTESNQNTSRDPTNNNTRVFESVQVIPNATFAKPFPDISKIEVFDGENFKRWQECVYFVLDMHGVAFALTESLSPTASEKQIECWIHANKMTEDVEVKVKINEYHKLLEDLKSENITFPEEFVARLLIEKLPQSWNDYKQQLKHKQLSMKELITHIIIEETNRKELKNANKREFTTRANLIEGNARRGMSCRHNSRFKNHAMPKSNNSRNNVMPRNHAMPKFNNPTFKKKGNCCYFYGKPGHYAHQCRHRKGRHENPANSNVNLVEADEIIVAVVSQANIVTNMTEWVIDYGATRHTCGNRNVFTSYTLVKEGEESVYLGDSRTASVHGKGKVMTKLTSGKTLALSDVFYVLDIRTNLVSVHC